MTLQIDFIHVNLICYNAISITLHVAIEAGMKPSYSEMGSEFLELSVTPGCTPKNLSSWLLRGQYAITARSVRNCKQASVQPLCSSLVLSQNEKRRLAKQLQFARRCFGAKKRLLKISIEVEKRLCSFSGPYCGVEKKLEVEKDSRGRKQDGLIAREKTFRGRKESPGG